MWKNKYPAAALLLMLALSGLAYCAAALAEQTELTNPDAAVKVVDARFILGQPKAGEQGVTVLGNLKNETGQPVSDLVVEARLLDAQGQVVDVLTDKVYPIVVMPASCPVCGTRPDRRA
jgi:hypothetical protein